MTAVIYVLIRARVRTSRQDVESNKRVREILVFWYDRNSQQINFDDTIRFKNNGFADERSAVLRVRLDRFDNRAPSVVVG